MPRVQTAGHKCRSICDRLEGYVGLKQIKFGPEMGYRKCTICVCHFIHIDYSKCKCCNFTFRVAAKNRRESTKERAKEFLESLST